MQKRPIGVEEKLPLLETIPLSLQHLFAMFGSTVLVPILFKINPATVLLFNGIGTILYLKVSLEDLTGRLSNMKARGVALRDGMTLEDLYRERTPIYERYADLTVSEEDRSIGDMVEAITAMLREQGRI